ncbi:hypothetical protein TrispH2_001060 [Trichoplax sp. H2]|nr:hypothetical protein TrispH2_001060 [Trichoplax sp. H2]|eukprot:RDD46733.1 hypothetical protein TrispH2_001060 [Trichoplax sp. H2]
MHSRIFWIATIAIYATLIAAEEDDNIFRGERILHRPDQVKLSWEADIAGNSVSFHFRAKSNSWIGIGLSRTGRAGDFEWHFGWTREQKPHEKEYREVLESVSSFYHHQYHGVVQDGDYKYMTFTQVIDSENNQISDEGVSLHVVHAYGDMDHSYHARQKRDDVIIDLVPVEVPGPETTQLVYICDGKIMHKKPSNYGECEDATDIRKFAATEQALIFGICIAFIFVIVIIVIAMKRWHRNMEKLKTMPTFVDEEEGTTIYKRVDTDEPDPVPPQNEDAATVRN